MEYIVKKIVYVFMDNVIVKLEHVSSAMITILVKTVIPTALVFMVDVMEILMGMELVQFVIEITMG